MKRWRDDLDAYRADPEAQNRESRKDLGESLFPSAGHSGLDMGYFLFTPMPECLNRCYFVIHFIISSRGVTGRSRYRRTCR